MPITTQAVRAPDDEVDVALKALHSSANALLLSAALEDDAGARKKVQDGLAMLGGFAVPVLLAGIIDLREGPRVTAATRRRLLDAVRMIGIAFEAEDKPAEDVLAPATLAPTD